MPAASTSLSGASTGIAAVALRRCRESPLASKATRRSVCRNVNIDAQGRGYGSDVRPALIPVAELIHDGVFRQQTDVLRMTEHLALRDGIHGQCVIDTHVFRQPISRIPSPEISLVVGWKRKWNDQDAKRRTGFVVGLVATYAYRRRRRRRVSVRARRKRRAILIRRQAPVRDRCVLATKPEIPVFCK